MDINFEKYPDGLVPAVVQDAATKSVLMVGFMNSEALEATKLNGKVTFYSRSRQTLWQKGETSGNYLELKDLLVDCDSDTILVKAIPAGPVCHTGAATCFGEKNLPDAFLYELENVIRGRASDAPDDSYTARLFAKGLNKIAQKVGEEAVELIIEAKDDDVEAFKSEAADLLYHFLVLLAAKGVALDDVAEALRKRRK